MKLLLVILAIFIVLLSFATGGENCGIMGGQCRNTCNPGEEILEGAFIDCGEKQDCCVPKAPQKEQSKDMESQRKWKKQVK